MRQKKTRSAGVPRKGVRQITVGGQVWRWRTGGRGSTVVWSPDGKSSVVSVTALTGRHPDTFDDGQRDGSSDGMIMPCHVRAYIERVEAGGAA